MIGNVHSTARLEDPFPISPVVNKVAIIETGRLILVYPGSLLVPHLARSIRRAGHRIVQASSPEESLRLLFGLHPDVVVLAWSAGPHLQHLLSRIRDLSDVPVFLLADKNDRPDEQLAHAWGANGILIKPIKLRRLRALMHMQWAASGHSAPIKIDWENRRVYRGARFLPLSRIDYQILGILAQAHGKPVSSERLGYLVWGWAEPVARLENLKVYIWRIRQKIEDDPHQPRFLQTVPGVGYRLELPPSSDKPES